MENINGGASVSPKYQADTAPDMIVHNGKKYKVVNEESFGEKCERIAITILSHPVTKASLGIVAICLINVAHEALLKQAREHCKEIKMPGGANLDTQKLAAQVLDQAALGLRSSVLSSSQIMVN